LSTARSADLQSFKAEFFKALAHPIRIRILEMLRAHDRSVQELQALLDLDQSTASQQLAVLRAKNIVTARKEGTTVRYAVRDALVGDLLD
jgi:DNA-binding transcriptional ArsR family regulator